MRLPGGATGMPAAPGGRLRAVSNRDAPPPAVRNAPPTHTRNERLAALAAVYARVLGQSVPSRDIAETLVRLSDAPTPVALAEALKDAGFLSEVQRDVTCQREAWPALARMTNGQTILVLEQGDAGLVIYDRTCPDNRATVPLADFAPFFSGETIRAEVPLGQLSGVHGAQGAATHWFWGEFAGFRRAFGEVVLGSFVANLLAVAVALFALQVYDRVIPHQSQATLWVLAGGAGLALLMEAALKLARARLMDGAGQQIELNVQTLLMNRVLGMRSELAGRAPSQLFSVCANSARCANSSPRPPSAALPMCPSSSSFCCWWR